MVKLRVKKRSKVVASRTRERFINKSLKRKAGDKTSNQNAKEESMGNKLAEVNYKTGTPDASETSEMDVYGQYNFYGSVRERIACANWSGITVLCAEPGMGKTWTLVETTQVWKKNGYATRREDFYGLNPQEAISKLVLITKWAQRARQAHQRRLLAIDNIPVGNEYELNEEARIIEGIASNNCSILIGMTPECEVLANEIAGAVVYWSCDLRSPRPLDPDDAYVYDVYSHGIPKLYDALNRVHVSDSGVLLSDPSYLEHFVSLLEKSLRPQLMGEERRMRFCMVLFGEGKLGDLKAVLSNVDDAVWRDIARDAPFFGIDVVHGSFSCVGSMIIDAFHAAYGTLAEIASEYPTIVMQTARRLAEKNLVLRSALVGSICSDAEMRTGLGLKWSAQYIDAGASDVVRNALEDAKSQGRIYLDGFYETECMVELIEGDNSLDLYGMLDNLRGHSRQTELTRLAIVCRGMWRGMFLAGDSEERESLALYVESLRLAADDSLSECLALHARVLELLAQGCLVEAYKLLLDVVGLLSSEHNSHALLSIDYMLCSLALGITPSSASVGNFDESCAALSAQGFTRLRSLSELVLPVGRLLGGRIGDGNEYDAAIHRADRAGDEFLKAILLLVSGVADMKSSAHLRAYVRIEQAAKVFSSMGLEVLEKEARLLAIAAHVALNESVKKSELQACKRFSRSLDYVVAVMERAQFSSATTWRSGTSYWANKPCPGDVLWLVNVLANDCKAFSDRFKKIMPITWLESVERSVAEVEGFFREHYNVEDRSAEDTQPDTKPYFEQELVGAGLSACEGGGPKIYVSLFGGLKLHVNDNLLPSAQLGKRNAGHLLALLAAVPEHRLPRFVVIESLWPDSDFNSGMKALYAATSVLRNEVKDLLGTDEEVNFVFSNRGEGTIGLNGSLVVCDVDVFEEKVLEVVLNEKNDRVVTDLCRTIERIYQGDLYVAPMDYNGVASKRRKRTREEFVDSMVQGAKSALNLGKKMLACHFAQKASDVNEMREDVVAVRAKTLYVTDREGDAVKCYEDFAATLVNKKQKPSQNLRKEMADTLGEVYWKEPNNRLRVPNKDNLKIELVDVKEKKEEKGTNEAS